MRRVVPNGIPPVFRRFFGESKGSAVAEFVMITTLLVLIALTLIQLALVLHVRNTLIDAAANGAHYGALANRSTADAQDRTRHLITESLHSGFAGNISVRSANVGEGSVITVSVETKVPLVGLLPNGWNLHVQGEAVKYG
ncbi:TadE/TadG family type IV pilus assembly protein [Glutamicibacter halophytocola]|uniref:TadE/TadG family type IV pilus assembly protein n=1 Tax=Glutamicibacter halophytocola TaxID=1933880 RepID=UPI00096B162A|nr:TadE/TadG family type IV pilus assembly protein [Glutamicibacter halophytocola]